MAPTTLLPWSWPPTWSGWSPSHRFSSDFRFDPLKSLYFRFLDFRLKIWASGLSFPVKVWFLCCVHIHHDSLVELAFTVNRLVFVSFAAGRLSKIFIQRCFHLSVTQFDNILDHISLWKKECIRNISQSLKENNETLLHVGFGLYPLMTSSTRHGPKPSPWLAAKIQIFAARNALSLHCTTGPLNASVHWLSIASGRPWHTNHVWCERSFHFHP